MKQYHVCSPSPKPRKRTQTCRPFLLPGNASWPAVACRACQGPLEGRPIQELCSVSFRGLPLAGLSAKRPGSILIDAVSKSTKIQGMHSPARHHIPRDPTRSVLPHPCGLRARGPCRLNNRTLFRISFPPGRPASVPILSFTSASALAPEPDILYGLIDKIRTRFDGGVLGPFRIHRHHAPQQEAPYGCPPAM